MSLFRIAGRIIADNKKAIEMFTFVTINGKLVIDDPLDHMKLVRLARTYSNVVRQTLNLIWSGYTHKETTKLLYDTLPNYVYLETAYKNAKAIIENIRFYEENLGKDRILADIHRFWITSRGNKWDRGNRNIKLIPRENRFEVLIKYPWDGSWIKAKAFFGEKYIPLLRELIELANKREEGYGAVISFGEYPRIHIQIPMLLYLKYFSMLKSRGYGLVAGFDINSDRLNVIVIDAGANIVAMKTFWYSEVVSHGFPREKARWIRVNTLNNALKWCGRIGVDYIVFEDLTRIKSRRFTANPCANRKVTKFAKKQVLIHGVINALKLGFTIVLVNPRGTSNSLTHKQVIREKGLDKHMASAYMIAYRGLKVIKSHENIVKLEEAFTHYGLQDSTP